MVDLNGHEAGNGGYSQGKPTAYRDSSTRREAILQHLSEFNADCRRCAVCDRLVWLWFHQVVVNQLIGIWSNSQIAPEWTVEGEGHEDNQPHEHG